MKLNFSTKQLFKYLHLIISLVVVFWLISLFEIYQIYTSQEVTISAWNFVANYFLNDFLTVAILAILIFPIYFLTALISKRLGVIIVQIIFVLVTLIQFSLVKYSLTTLLFLGADILGYSYSDIYITTASSGATSMASLIPFLVLPIVLIVLRYLITNYFKNTGVLLFLGVLLLSLVGAKLVLPSTFNTDHKNKLYFFVEDIIRYQVEKSLTNVKSFANRDDYPLLRPSSEIKDVLSPFFNTSDSIQGPNIVILMIEGLGGEFVGNHAYAGFTPYLDSLIPKSLYWENFVSNSGRTFGVYPSLLASLPYGDNGFMQMEKLPSHISLISVLKANGYTTSYYSGGRSSFDRKINFFEDNGIDFVVDEGNFGPGYARTQATSEGFSWGYPDGELYRKILASLNGLQQPRLDIVLTISNHEPFKFPNKSLFLKRVDSIFSTPKISSEEKNILKPHKEILASLMYTDYAIKNFIEAYKKRPDYKHTIFIITGDHRLIPIPQKDKLCRFHVPMIIYSPMLKRTKRFKSISSHWDIAPSLMSFLEHNYPLLELEEVAWMSNGLDTVAAFRNIHKIPLMRTKGGIHDYIYKDYFYSRGKLYKIKEDFNVYNVSDKQLLKEVVDSLNAFKKLNAYVTKKNKIYPEALNIYKKSTIVFSDEEIATIQELTSGLSFDETFNVAKKAAFEGDYKTARLLCNYILSEIPNHADARILKGRTYAWENNFKQAELELQNVLKRVPYYDEVYLALIDLYWWMHQDEKSISIAKKAYKNNLKNPNISFKLAKAYQRMNDLKQATKLMDSILQIYPENQNYITFKQSLKQ